MKPINLLVDYKPKAEDNSFLRNKIVEFNAAILHEQASQFTVLAKTEHEDIIGGATVWEHSDAFYIDILWVDAAHRKNKIGSQLIQQIAEQALAKNIKKLFVDTYSFQAVDFYLKQGFIVIGQLENYLLGYDRIYFRKDLN